MRCLGEEAKIKKGSAQSGCGGEQACNKELQGIAG